MLRLGSVPVLVLALTACVSTSDRDRAGDQPVGEQPDGHRELLDDTTELHYDQLAQWGAAGAAADSYGVAWPDSTRDLDLLEGGFQDPYYLARVTIDAADVDALLGPALCAEPPAAVDGGVGPAIATGPGWWTPDQATTACSGTEGNQTQWIGLVDQGDAEVVVYISTFFT